MQIIEREMAYKTLVRPIVEYSSTVWSPNTDQNIDTLEMIQRRAAGWTLHNYSTYASVTEMLQSLSWRSLEQRRSDSRLCLFYKITPDLVAIDLPLYVVHPLRILRNSPPLLLPNSDHCGLLQVLILPPCNRAMEPAAITHSTSAHF